MPRRRLLPVRDWPLSIKLATTVLALAVIPLFVAALINAYEVESQSLVRETQNLQRRSAAAAHRLEERVGRLRAYVELVATNPTIVDAVLDAPLAAGGIEAAARRWDDRHPEIDELLVSLRRANPWFANVYLLDPAGVCIATSERATKPEMVGRPYDYRPYFQSAVGDRTSFVTDVLKNATSPGTGIFVSAPVLVEGTVRAVAVLKVDSIALHEVVADLARTGGSALLVDRFGVVVSDAWTGTLRDTDDPQSLQFHPLASVARFYTLFEQTRRYGTPDGDHYLDRVREPLALDRLWNALQQRRAGASEHDIPAAFGSTPVPAMVGYAPVLGAGGEPYGYVVLGEPAAEFREPLRAIAQAALIRFGLVAIGVALVIALLIRRFSRQVVDLAEGARRLADGERAGSLELDRRDELGVLAASIQRLADHVHDAVAAEQAARRASERARDVAESLAQARTVAVARAHAALAGARRMLESTGPVDPREGLRRLAAQLEGAALDLAVLGDGDAGLHPSPRRLVVATLVQQVLDDRHEDVTERRLALVVADDVPEIETDRAMLRRIIEHLVDNACKFTRHGTIEVRISRHDGGVRLAVADPGIGLTARQAKRITADGSEPIGTGGIGLWVTRRLARALGASLRAQGEVGVGSTVTIELPPVLEIPVAARTPGSAAAPSDEA